ncbi:MAG: glycerophosphoryl diester phosphodiesterase membrane domain-containing protein [Chloroflexota bacterium]
MTTIPELRSMSFIDILDTAFRIYRAHFLTFVGIVALLQIPFVILQTLFQFTVGWEPAVAVTRFSSTPTFSGSGFPDVPLIDLVIYYVGLIGFSVLQSLVLFTLITGALAHAISRIYLGQPISIITAYQFGRRQYLALIVATFALFLVLIVLYALFIACIAGGVFATISIGGETGVWAGVGLLLAILFVSLAFLILLAFVYTRMVFITQTVVLESHGPLAAIGRSWRLTARYFWRTFGILATMIILAYIVYGIPTAIIQLGIAFTGGFSPESQILGQNIGVLVAQIGYIIALPLQFVTYTLLYYDLRIRKEGFDIELKSQQTPSYA